MLTGGCRHVWVWVWYVMFCSRWEPAWCNPCIDGLISSDAVYPECLQRSAFKASHGLCVGEHCNKVWSLFEGLPVTGLCHQVRNGTGEAQQSA